MRPFWKVLPNRQRVRSFICHISLLSVQPSLRRCESYMMHLQELTRTHHLRDWAISPNGAAEGISAGTNAPSRSDQKFAEDFPPSKDPKQ